MFKPYFTLPHHYECVKTIDFIKNKGLAIVLNVLSLVLFGLSVAVFAMLKGGFSFDFHQILIISGLSILYIIIHEWIHGLFFKINLKKKVTYRFHGIAASAGVPGVYYQKVHFMLITIAPVLITTLIVTPLLCVANDYWYFILAMLFSINLSASTGDLYSFVKFIFVDRQVLVEDYGPGMNIFLPKKKG